MQLDVLENAKPCVAGTPQPMLLLVNNFFSPSEPVKALVGFCCSAEVLAPYMRPSARLVSIEREKARKKQTTVTPLRLGPRHGVHLDPSVPMLQVPFRVLDNARPAQSSTFEPVGLDASLM